jgi:hypothetical protein
MGGKLLEQLQVQRVHGGIETRVTRPQRLQPLCPYALFRQTGRPRSGPLPFPLALPRSTPLRPPLPAPDCLELDDLSLLGPIFVLKLNTTPPGFRRKLTTELWLYPDGSRILELSTKCKPKDMFQVAAEARAFLLGLGIDLSGRQQTKTKTALQQFARRLSAA